MSTEAWANGFVPYGGGRKAPVGGLSDPALLARLLLYKRQVAKHYRVLEAAKMETALPKGTLWISPKLDGELWFLVRRNGDLALCAHNGRVLQGIPLLTALAARLKGAPDLLVAGELVAPISEGRPRSHHLATALGDEAHAKALAFHPFDLVDDGGQDALARPYAERLARLQSLFGESGTITTVTGDAASAASHYREWVAAGKHEGLVVRSEQNLTFKIKPHFSIDAVVIAFGERLVGDARQLRELSVALVRDDGSFQVLGTVGTGFSEEDRIAWQQRLSAMEAPSSFRMANSEGTLSRFVRPELVVEVRCSDLLVSDGDDLAIRRMTLGWDAAAGWKPLGEHVTAVMLHPVFLRGRTDKRVDAGDCGLGQLASRVQFEDEIAAAPGTAGTATVCKREVWTKEMKGLLGVRKYVLIQTNKQDRDYPPLVLFCTDFSPGRAEPLQTSLRSAADRAAADAQIAAWIEENIKKGWNPAGPGAAPIVPTPATEAEAPVPKKRAAKKAKT
jgi:hypothetical protein